jgi:lipopolysaccharide biosynthesis regulator YciM
MNYIDKDFARIIKDRETALNELKLWKKENPELSMKISLMFMGAFQDLTDVNDFQDRLEYYMDELNEPSFIPQNIGLILP